MTEKQKDWIKIVLLSTTILFVMVKFAQNPEPIPEVEKIIVGQIYPTVGVTYSCPTEENFENMMRLLDARNYEGIEKLKFAVEIVPLPEGTNVKIIETDGNKIKVMVINGFYKNSVVYIMYGSLVK